MDLGQAEVAETNIGDSSTKSDIVEIKSGNFKCFQVIKSTPLGLGAPTGYRLDVSCLEGADDDLQNHFYTTTIGWWAQRVFLPADFRVMSGPRPGDGSYGAEVANIEYKSIEGIFHMNAKVTLVEKSKPRTYEDEIPSASRFRSISITRGWARHYETDLRPSGPQLKWKGTKKALNLLDDEAPRCNGNLKLVHESYPFQPETLAVWKNRTDPSILGALHVSRAAVEEGGITLHDVVSSCLAIVVSERLNFRGWLGGGHPL